MEATPQEDTKQIARIGRPRKVDRPGGTAGTKASLVRAAAKVFAARGYERGTVSEIASEAGLTAGAIYRHFPSKADLLLAVVKSERGVSPQLEDLDAHVEVTPRHFAGLICRYAQGELRQLRRLAVEVHAAASRDNDAGRSLLDYTARIRSALADRIAECARSCALSTQYAPAHMASLILVLLMGLANIDTLDPDLIDDEAWILFLSDAVARMLGEPL